MLKSTSVELMTGSELANTLEERFGYPLRDAQIIDHLQAYLELWPKQEPAKSVGVFLKENVHWKAEHQPGDAPFAGEQLPAIAGRHFSGLFAFRFGYSFGNMGKNAERGAWLADLNPGSSAQVYYQSATKLTECPVLESPRELTEAQTLFRAVRDTVEEQPQENGRLAKQFAESYPRVLALMPEWFSKHGVRVPENECPCPSVARPIAAYRAFLPIVEVLLRRATGERAMLSQAAAKECLARLADPAYTPHLLLKLLAQALSGDAAATETATRAQNGGVKLTRIWAEKVLKHEPPFQS